MIRYHLADPIDGYPGPPSTGTTVPVATPPAGAVAGYQR